MKSMQRPITADRITELLGQFIILRGGVYTNQIVRLNGFYRRPGYLVLQVSTKTNPRAEAQMSTTHHKIAIIPDQAEAAAAFAE